MRTPKCSTPDSFNMLRTASAIVVAQAWSTKSEGSLSGLSRNIAAKDVNDALGFVHKTSYAPSSSRGEIAGIVGDGEVAIRRNTTSRSGAAGANHNRAPTASGTSQFVSCLFARVWRSDGGNPFFETVFGGRTCPRTPFLDGFRVADHPQNRSYCLNLKKLGCPIGLTLRLFC